MQGPEISFSMLQNLRPTQQLWVPTSLVPGIVQARGNAFVSQSRELEEDLLVVDFDEKSDSFKSMYRSTRVHKSHIELAHFQNHLCADFKVFDTLHKLKSKFVRWTLGQKTAFLAQSALDRPIIPVKRQASTLRLRYRQVCLQCHRTGHLKEECIFRCAPPIGLTANQRTLYKFLKDWKSNLLPLKTLRRKGKTPSLASLLSFEK